MARTAGQWGNVVLRKRKLKDGTISYSWRARYPHPLLPGGNPPVTQCFPYTNARDKGRKAAEDWLAREHDLVNRHFEGIATWTHPKERKKLREQAWQKQHTDFMSYAVAFIDEISVGKAEGSKRKDRETLSHINEMSFTHGAISDIAENDIRRWYRDEMNDIPSAKKRTYQMLKRILNRAVEDGLIDRNPCTMKNPKVEISSRQNVAPATAEELQTIYSHMPEYSRIFVYMAAMCGLRINEVCALQLRDIDLKNKILHVRHSVGRGERDRGSRRLKSTKTASSTADLVIPDYLCTLLEERFRITPNGPDAMLIESPWPGHHIIGDQAVRRQFKEAAAIAGRPDLTPHQLKSLFTDTLIHENLSPRETADAARHTSETVNFLYQRAPIDRLREGVNRAAAHMMPRTREQIEDEMRQTKERLARLEAELARASR